MMRLSSFLARNQKCLTVLQGQLEAIKQGRKSPDDFYRLGKLMEGYRDFIGDFLDRLSERKRGQVENEVSPAIFTLTEEVRKLTGNARERLIIDEGLASDIGMMATSLLFVSMQSKIVVEGVRLHPKTRHGHHSGHSR